MWLVESGIAKLLSVPQLEVDSFIIYYNTKRDWVVTTPEGDKIEFKIDTGNCKGFPFIEMGSQEALPLFQYASKVDTVRGDLSRIAKHRP